MGGGTVTGDIKIFDTDYTSYKILYDCNNVMGGLMKYETFCGGHLNKLKIPDKEMGLSQGFAVHSRDPTISDDGLKAAKSVIKEKLPQYDLDWWWWTLEWTWQNGMCDYESGWKFDS